MVSPCPKPQSSLRTILCCDSAHIRSVSSNHKHTSEPSAKRIALQKPYLLAIHPSRTMANDSGPQWVAYRYDPSMAAAILFCILVCLIQFTTYTALSPALNRLCSFEMCTDTKQFSMLTILHLTNLIRTRTWVLIPFLIGGFFESIGYIGRILSANQTPDWSLGPYIMQTLLLLLAPALFAASIYMVLGRIILVTEGQRHAVVRVKWLTTIFVMGDVVSFLAQSGGTLFPILLASRCQI